MTTEGKQASAPSGATLPCSMAFAHFDDDQPTVMWRVVWWRLWGKDNERRLRCSDHFASEEAAWNFVSEKTGLGHEVIRVDVYELRPAI